MLKTLLRTEETDYSEEKRESTPLVSKGSLCRRFRRGPEARAAFVESHINKGLAYQFRAMGEPRVGQEELANLVGMPQTAISRLESPNYGKPTITTLKRMARVHDVALIVRFVPFSKLADWVSGTPYVELGLSSDALDVPSFEEEQKEGVFENRVSSMPILVETISSLHTIESRMSFGDVTSLPSCRFGIMPTQSRMPYFGNEEYTYPMFASQFGVNVAIEVKA